MNENTFVDSPFYQFNIFCLFFVFQAILTSSTYFFVELQQKKRKLKPFLGIRVWAPKPVHRAPKRAGYVTGNAQLLLINMVYTSCLTSCQMT